MATGFISQIADIYNDLCYDTDPRIRNWPFVQDPRIPLLLIAAYLLFVYLGPKWMSKRKPFELKPVLVVYNFSMCLLSAYVVNELLQGGWLYDYTLGCQQVDYSNSPKAMRMARAVWFFFITKFIELLDTVFFILRKKDNQVTFLHVFHHGCLPMFWWWGVKKVPGGFGTFHGLVNGIVHVVMYFYYGMSCLGPRVQKYLWWKRYVTVIQLSQFFIVTLHNSQFLFMECEYPTRYVVFIQLFTTIVAVLFFNFYYQTYTKSAKRAEKSYASTNDVETNGHVSNGSASVFDGYSNHVMPGLKDLGKKDIRRRMV